jgi:hypothetical protein
VVWEILPAKIPNLALFLTGQRDLDCIDTTAHFSHYSNPQHHFQSKDLLRLRHTTIYIDVYFTINFSYLFSYHKLTLLYPASPKDQPYHTPIRLPAYHLSPLSKPPNRRYSLNIQRLSEQLLLRSSLSSTLKVRSRPVMLQSCGVFISAANRKINTARPKEKQEEIQEGSRAIGTYFSRKINSPVAS